MARGRPPSPEALSIRDYLAALRPDNGARADQIARDLKIAKHRAQDTLDRLVQRDEAKVIKREPVPGVRKPVCVYAGVQRSPDDLPLFDVMRAGFTSGYSTGA
jgi:predicted ArsR family transcriptional regulator